MYYIRIRVITVYNKESLVYLAQHHLGYSVLFSQMMLLNYAHVTSQWINKEQHENSRKVLAKTLNKTQINQTTAFATIIYAGLQKLKNLQVLERMQFKNLNLKQFEKNCKIF